MAHVLFTQHANVAGVPYRPGATAELDDETAAAYAAVGQCKIVEHAESPDETPEDLAADSEPTADASADSPDENPAKRPRRRR